MLAKTYFIALISLPIFIQAAPVPESATGGAGGVTNGPLSGELPGGISLPATAARGRRQLNGIGPAGAAIGLLGTLEQPNPLTQGLSGSPPPQGRRDVEESGPVLWKKGQLGGLVGGTLI